MAICHIIMRQWDNLEKYVVFNQKQINQGLLLVSKKSSILKR